MKRVNLCSGKIYYDLLEKQQADQRKDVAIVRIEQIYPMPETQLEVLMKNMQMLNTAGCKKNLKIWVLGCIFCDMIGHVDLKK